MDNVIITIISWYQRLLSPLMAIQGAPSANGCRFYPSCSHYSQDAVRKYGAAKGLLKSVLRILRCNPWSQGGIDEV